MSVYQCRFGEHPDLELEEIDGKENLRPVLMAFVRDHFNSKENLQMVP
jgi:hypothetical protein